jgi:hypothetical protein
MTACRWEADVLRAAREDRWADNLRRHLAECDDCAMTASIAPWMTSFARLGDREHRLPDPSIVWLKAKLMQGTAEASRATRPLTIIQMVSYLVVAGGWASVLMWKWDAIEKWIHGLTPTGVISNTASLSLSFFGIVFVLASMTVMLALHTILAEDV